MEASRKSSMRVINVAAAQLGPIQKADSREAVVKRMIALMDEAKAKGADLIVYPELALTTFFPRWYMEDQAEVDTWFEREMPNAATRPLFERAARHQMAMSFGYAELTPNGHHFNTSILTDKSAKIVGTYRKIHLPGHSEFDTNRAYQHSTWVVCVAKAGVEDGHPLIGGSLIVDPNGEIAVEASTEEDELLVHPCDLDATAFGKQTILNFANHRRIEHYGLITSRTGAVLPLED